MNRVRDVMTEDPICCLPTTSLKVVARLMLQYDCGAIPVVYSIERPKIVGIITDRDITCRTIAHGLNPLELTAEDAMTTPAKVVNQGMLIEDCCALMKEEKIRRVPVVDEEEYCCGMVSMADIARKTDENVMSSLVHEILLPSYEMPMEVS